MIIRILFTILSGLMLGGVYHDKGNVVDSIITRGYFRTTIGESDGGGVMTNFIAPGALSRYRLGNEPNTYAELEIGYNHRLEKSSKRSFDVVLMLSGFSALGSGDSFNMNHVSQLYAKMNNAVGDADVWIGKRYYARRDYHIIDYFWYNPGQEAQVGMGVENIRGKDHVDDISVALFSFENKDVRGLNVAEGGLERGILRSYTVDAKWGNIGLSENGSLSLWGRYSRRHSNKALGYSLTHGFGAGLWHDQRNILGGMGSNNFQFSYKKGSVISQSQYVGTPVYETFGDDHFQTYDLSKAYAVEFSDQLVYELDERYAFNALLLYRMEDRGIVSGDSLGSGFFSRGRQVHWFSVGGRFLKYFHRHFNMALEVGSDYVNNQPIGRHGWLTKLTLAPQLSWDYGFYSRPVLRPFLTYALWSRSLIGAIGHGRGGVFSNVNRGFTYGLSFELFW
ncbi:carbohydrate porin [Elizabethkingia anophelis]|uniref:carbohydrate porin n=1 Tax=Elizabethkingia anophelis TaxID=1117645 RepID=UPI0038919D00